MSFHGKKWLIENQNRNSILKSIKGRLYAITFIVVNGKIEYRMYDTFSSRIQYFFN